MTRKSNLLIVLCVLMSALMLLGVLMLQPLGSVQAASSVTTLQMVPGASIRQGSAEEVTEGITNTNGIRFSAEISVTEYETLLRENDKVSAGTFIAPYDYAKYAEINKENCFTGATQVYKWEGKTLTPDVSDEVLTILHVPGRFTKQVSKVNKNEEVYRVNGSVVSILSENLDRNYIGISYIKVEKGETVDYFFADVVASNSRSPISVAQKILLSDEATIEEKDIATGYAETYLQAKGGSVTQVVNYNIYENGANGFEKVQTASKEITFDSVDDFSIPQTIAPEREDAVLIKAKSDSATLSVEFGKEQNLDFYYEPTIGNAVLFDSGRANGSDDLLSANNAVINNLEVLKADSAWGYNGNSSLWFNDCGNGIGYSVITFADPIVLPAPTNTISFMVKNSLDPDWQVSTNVPNLMFVNNGTTSLYGGFYLQEGAGKEYKVTVNIYGTPENHTISQVKQIAFFTNHDSTTALDYSSTWYYGEDIRGKYEPENNGKVGEYNPINIDFIQAEYPLLASNSDFGKNIEITQADVTLGKKVIELPEYLSTEYSSKDLSAGTTVTYQQLPSGAVSEPLSIVDGKVEIPVAESCTYQVNYSFNLGSTTVEKRFYLLGYYPYMVEDFENGNSTVNNLSEIVQGISFDGSKALRTLNVGKDANTTLTFANSPINADHDLTTMCLWIYNPNSFALTLVGSNVAAPGGMITTYRVKTLAEEWGTPLANSFTIQPGWGYYEIALRTNQAWDPMRTVSQISIWHGAFGDTADYTVEVKWDARFDRIALK